uniref:Uncharacterized protein n=1 Tax=Aegilops tauschii subsp. strangulata TaxID=200361 RepID=A0A453STD7_AEGTS
APALGPAPPHVYPPSSAPTSEQRRPAPATRPHVLSRAPAPTSRPPRERNRPQIPRGVASSSSCSPPPPPSPSVRPPAAASSGDRKVCAASRPLLVRPVVARVTLVVGGVVSGNCLVSIVSPPRRGPF